MGSKASGLGTLTAPQRVAKAMFDQTLNRAVKSPLQRLAAVLVARGVRADTVTWVGFVLGMSAIPLIALGYSQWALLSMGLNRLADGLDGAVARQTRATDRGAFLDISLDFLFYSAIPLAFVLAAPQTNGLPGALLIYSFIGTGCTFLAFAVLAAQRGHTSSIYPQKGIYYLGGLTESTETMAVLVAMCLWPHWFAPLAYGFAALCALTTVTRIAAGIATFQTR